MTTEIATSVIKFSDESLRNITNFSDAMALLDATAIEAESFDAYGTGFKVIKEHEKARLVGVPFVILEWHFNPGAYESEFASLTVVTQQGEKLIINDGGAGIPKQLRSVTEQRIKRQHPTPQNGLGCKAGLSKSDYKVDLPNAKGELIPTPATTYYLAE